MMRIPWLDTTYGSQKRHTKAHDGTNEDSDCREAVVVSFVQPSCVFFVTHTQYPVENLPNLKDSFPTPHQQSQASPFGTADPETATIVTLTKVTPFYRTTVYAGSRRQSFCRPM